jgi:hypothetical protein
MMNTPMRAGRRIGFLVSLVLALAGAGAGGCTDGGTDRGPPTPFTVHFRFENRGAVPVFLYESCLLDVKVRKVDGRDVSPAFNCACPCDDATCTGPLLCGACFEQPREIAAGGHLDWSWTAAETALRSRGSWQCVQSTSLPVGGYRIEATAYDSAAAASRTGARVPGIDFELPPPERVVLDVSGS